MDGQEDSDCVEGDGAVDGVAVVGDEALGYSWIQGFQDGQLLTRPGERRRKEKENLVRHWTNLKNRKTCWTYDCLSYKTFRDEK